jgi:hypothetical protein
MIIFSIIYCLFLCGYFVTRVGKNIKARAINKYIMATMYLVYAIVQYQLGYGLGTIETILMVALFLAYLGDIFLVFDLNRGGDFFLAGNIAFVVYYLALFNANGLAFGDYWFVLVAWLVIYGAFIVCSNLFPKVFKFGKMKSGMAFYLASIMLHGMFGLGAMILIPSTAGLICGLGSLMFMISDCILTVDKFVIVGNKWITRSNSFFYFIGLLLIVLSLGL